jgi:hypothetical protein
MNEQRGCVEIRWASDGDPDDVVTPWPRSSDGLPVTVHVERMDDGDIWMNIHEKTTKTDVHMWFRAVRKNELEWTVRKQHE